MSPADELEAAIAAHHQWKARLRHAITFGTFDAPIEVLRGDAACALGQWLRNTPELYRDAQWKQLHTLHVAFHRAAAEVATLATTGHAAEADEMMSIRGAYTVALVHLTRALLEWPAHAHRAA